MSSATFMPTLVERFAKGQPRAAAQVEGLAPKELPEVLSVCVHKAGRSQIVAALAQHLDAGRIRVRERHVDELLASLPVPTAAGQPGSSS
jgi:hypothetical protein